MPPYLLFQLYRVASDAVLARQVSRLCPSLVLAQNRNDLLFREPARSIVCPSSRARTLILRGGKTQWQVIRATVRAFLLCGPSAWR
jgi:hypothetical protein